MEPFYQPPVAQKQPIFSRRMILIATGLAIAVILAIVLMVLSGRNPVGHDFGLAVAREQTLYDLTDEAEGDVNSPDLAKITSDAQTLFLSDTTVLSNLLPRVGLKGVPKDIAAAEAADDFSSQLDSAKQNNNFDKTYQQLLSEKIDTQAALLKKVYDKAGNESVKQALSDAYANLQSLQRQLEALNF